MKHARNHSHREESNISPPPRTLLSVEGDTHKDDNTTQEMLKKKKDTEGRATNYAEGMTQITFQGGTINL